MELKNNIANYALIISCEINNNVNVAKALHLNKMSPMFYNVRTMIINEVQRETLRSD